MKLGGASGLRQIGKAIDGEHEIEGIGGQESQPFAGSRFKSQPLVPAVSPPGLGDHSRRYI